MPCAYPPLPVRDQVFLELTEAVQRLSPGRVASVPRSRNPPDVRSPQVRPGLNERSSTYIDVEGDIRPSTASTPMINSLIFAGSQGPSEPEVVLGHKWCGWEMDVESLVV